MHMQITVNGQQRETTSQDLHSLVLSLELDPSVVVAELNGNIVPGTEFMTTALHDGDKLELLSFVGGG